MSNEKIIEYSLPKSTKNCIKHNYADISCNLDICNIVLRCLTK